MALGHCGIQARALNPQPPSVTSSQIVQMDLIFTYLIYF